MKRVLMTVALAATFALAAGTTAFASAPHHATSAHAAAKGSCDASHCPFASCPFGGAKVSSTASLKNGKACSGSASCQGSCPRQSAGVVAANVAKR